MSTIPEGEKTPQGSSAPPPHALPKFRELTRHAEKSHELHEAGKIRADSYLQMLFTQLALPYREPRGMPIWTRQNGRHTLTIQPGALMDRNGNLTVAYPYGSKARMFLIWLTTEVKRHNTRELNLGPSLNAFMESMGLKHTGGHQRRAVEDQLRRLFGATITVQTHSHKSDGTWTSEGATMTIAKTWQLWYSEDDQAGSTPLAGSRVVLSESFYESIMQSAVPLARDVLRELQSHPMRLDIYVWLVHRLYKLPRETHISWAQLEQQFGGNYARRRAFVAAFTENLHVVRMYYPEARISTTKQGVILRPSARHVGARRTQRRYESSAQIMQAGTAG